MVAQLHEELSQRVSHTTGVLQNVRVIYEHLANRSLPGKLSPDAVSQITEGYLSILAKETPIDNEGITNLISYAAPRLPKEIFSTGEAVTLTFNSDPSFFINEDGPLQGVESAKKRRRWHKLEENNITIHAQSQTAVIETLVHVSFVKRLQDKAKEILLHTKKTPEEEAFLHNIAELIGKISVEEWAHKAIHLRGDEKLAPWDSLKSSNVTEHTRSSPTALKLAELAETKLQGENQPSMLFFSNSHSLSNILSHYMLQKNIDVGTLHQYIRYRAMNEFARGATNTPLGALGESLQGIDTKLSGDQQRFIADNLIIYHLTKGGTTITGDAPIDTFIREFTTPDRLSKCGIKTLVQEHQSPTADALHYIDFNKMTDEVLDGINPLFREAVRQLRTNKISALFMPYAPGDLTYSVILEMERKFKSLTTVAEVGKVAHSIHSLEQRAISNIGDLVIPVGTCASYGGAREEVFDNQATLDDVRIFGSAGVAKTTIMEAPSVILQDPDEMEEIVHKKFGEDAHKKNISINMEAGNLRAGALADANRPLTIIEVDYLSDHAFSQRILALLKASGRANKLEQITSTLDLRGVFGVHAATAAVLTAWARKVEDDKKKH